MKPPPPIPDDCGSTTFNANWTAAAASIAFPPAFKTSLPILAAFGSLVATTPPLPPGTPTKGNPLQKPVLERDMKIMGNITKRKICDFDAIVQIVRYAIQVRVNDNSLRKDVASNIIGIGDDLLAVIVIGFCKAIEIVIRIAYRCSVSLWAHDKRKRQ